LSHDFTRADPLSAARGVPKHLWQWFSGPYTKGASYQSDWRYGGLFLSVNCTWPYIRVLNVKEKFPEPHKEQQKLMILGKWPTWCTNSFLCSYFYL